jgi:DOPA 4,5-dioxygenase
MTTPDAPYHVHVYYEARTRAAAAAYRDRLLKMVVPDGEPGLLYVGELRDHKVGPHPVPQFEVRFRASLLPTLLPLVRASGFTVLVHPLTLDDMADHTSLAQWIGEPIPLDLGVLDPPGINQGFERFGKRDI